MLYASGLGLNGAEGLYRNLGDGRTWTVGGMGNFITFAGAGLPATGSQLETLGNLVVGARTRWRASRGSAPVGRFTRAFGDNATDGWHRTMPVSIEVTVGTTATVAALFVLGATSTAEARATAAAAGAFVLALAAVAQGAATASTTGTLSAGATSTAEARAAAGTTGTLSLGATIIAEARATASAGATFVLGIASTAGRALVEGLVTAVLTLRQSIATVLTRRAAVESVITSRPAVQTDLTARDAVDAALAYQSDDPVP